ncbi:variable large family protein (plasmid) [Borreliella tanukii]|uniref:variable large family protein n=1 Tax=Borreliella tanukii TaxID=56146 RepID=UPI003AEFE4AC
MIKAAKDAAKVGGDGGNDKIGDAGDNKGAVADKDSVKGIAKGIKGIVAAAEKAFGKEGNALKDVKEAAENEANADAGKLFAGGNGANAAAAGDIAKAASAVTAVSGEQILKAIVDAAAGDEANQAGAAAGQAKNPIEAAIGADDAGAAFGNDGMKKSNDNIAAAIVLRGVAKDGKFAVANANKANVKSAVESAVSEVSGWLEEMIKAVGEAAKGGDGGGNDKIGDVGAANNKGAVADANSVKGIAKGIKGIVAAAGKAFGKEGNALKDVAAAAGEANADAGKLFAGKDGNAGAGAADIGKAASAVTAVSGEQILKAIVEAAGDEKNQAGVAAGQAKNPIAAAIGTDAAAAAFGNDGMKKSNDNIAAAIVLRGVAKGGKFAVANANKASVKGAVESAVDKEIAKGIKGIVAAAGKAFGKEGNALKDVTAADDDNKEAGKLFASGNGANAADAIGKAASAVTAVSGEQILKAIVDAAAGDAKNQDGKKASEATNPIEAAIGTDADGAAFGNEMKKRNDKIAAAIVLRGVAKGGKFAVKEDY